jgi:lipopolysaccharide/colanic/teichoic acid biosynthesis glycosyltransferase
MRVFNGLGARPAGSGVRGLTGAARIADAVGGIPTDDAFRRMVALERRRSERSGHPFAVMLLDCRTLATGDRESASRIVRSLTTVVRDTDVVGWYQSPHIVGVLFTTIGTTDRAATSRALLARVTDALQPGSQHVGGSDVRISLHFFPEEAGASPSPTPGGSLHPEVLAHDAARPSTAKRAIDVLGSLLALTLFSPLVLIIALAIKLTSAGPVFFKQRRLGRTGREFTLLKFRSMYVDSDHGVHKRYVQEFITRRQGPSGPGAKRIYKLTADPRVTPVGKLLRRTSLDELPQFLNVLRGEMSLVGPRPPLQYEFACYAPWQRRRVLETQPGMTGLWQVTGRSRTTFEEMVRLDLRYVRQQSLWLDLKILLRTPLAVLSGIGAY